MTKTVIAQLSIEKSKIDQFLTSAQIMIEKSNAEAECVHYELYKKTDTATDFLFHEKYENENAVEKHNSSKHFTIFLNSVTPLLTKKPIIELF